ncbi:MAG: phage major capsid protein [Clostridia bacterium]|nr:phage major capsid protein [Clostridia bacterium]
MADYKNITLDKGLYVGKGFSYNLEQLDPSENYKGTSLEGLDAFGRQLKRFDIKISGKNSDVIDKFFSSSQTAALFPEFVVRAVSNGLEGSEALSAISAVKTKIDGLDYRGLTSSISDTSTPDTIVGEGSQIPEINISLSNSIISLRKYGRMLVASYEALRFQKIGVFSIALKQIGEYIAYMQLGAALGVLVNGNDGYGTCENIGVNNDLSYTDLINLWNSMGQHKMTTLIINPSTLPKLLNMTEFRDAAAGLNFHATGKLITPFGAQIIRSDYVPANSVVALDRNSALEMVQSGDVTVESDKLIDRQLEKVAITSTCGFNRIDESAVKTLTFVS